MKYSTNLVRLPKKCVIPKKFSNNEEEKILCDAYLMKYYDNVYLIYFLLSWKIQSVSSLHQVCIIADNRLLITELVHKHLDNSRPKLNGKLFKSL